jgi:hypothetical protein
MFGACCILHSMLLDHDGLDNWEHRMRRCRLTRGVGDTVNLTPVQISRNRMMDDILYNYDGKMLLGQIMQTSMNITMIMTTLTVP